MRSTIITCVNPKAYTTGSCTAYRDKDVKCHYAFGFRNIAAKLKVIGQYQTFMSLCLRYYCRTVYYDMYSGHHIITPHDQSTIIRCASDVGLNLPPHPFDEEVEAIDW